MGKDSLQTGCYELVLRWPDERPVKPTLMTRPTRWAAQQNEVALPRMSALKVHRLWQRLEDASLRHKHFCHCLPLLHDGCHLGVADFAVVGEAGPSEVSVAYRHWRLHRRG